MENNNNPAVKCGNCGKFYDKNFGLCPFCGTKLPEAETPPNAFSAVVAAQNEIPPSEQKPFFGTNRVIKRNESSNRITQPWIMLFLLAIAQILAWSLPWTKLGANSKIMEVMANEKIHYLNYLETPAYILRQGYYVKIHTEFYHAAMGLMLASIAVMFIYFILSFTEKFSGKIKGTIGAVCMILAALSVELYRIDINSALEKVGLNEIYDFSTTGVSIIVIIVAIVAIVVGRRGKGKPELRKENKKKTEDLPVFHNRQEGWQYDIERMEDKILLERYHNEYEWSEEYREICYKELLRRNIIAEKRE